MESKGLGDTIEKITKATGIKTAVETITKSLDVEGCGCAKRKEALNNPNLLVNKVFYNKEKK